MSWSNLEVQDVLEEKTLAFRLQKQLRACPVREMETHLGQRDWHEQSIESTLESGHHILLGMRKEGRTRQRETPPSPRGNPRAVPISVSHMRIRPSVGSSLYF